MKRLRITVSGHVQGVGFRYRVRETARSLGIKGWVKNLSDGKVGMEIEGEEIFLNQLQDELNNFFRGYIESMEIEELKPVSETGFQIRL